MCARVRVCALLVAVKRLTLGARGIADSAEDREFDVLVATYLWGIEIAVGQYRFVRS